MLFRSLRKAKTTLRALNVELSEAEDAKTNPVLLPTESLDHARAFRVGGSSETSTDLAARRSA